MGGVWRLRLSRDARGLFQIVSNVWIRAVQKRTSKISSGLSLDLKQETKIKGGRINAFGRILINPAEYPYQIIARGRFSSRRHQLTKTSVRKNIMRMCVHVGNVCICDGTYVYVMGVNEHALEAYAYAWESRVRSRISCTCDVSFDSMGKERGFTGVVSGKAAKPVKFQDATCDSMDFL